MPLDVRSRALRLAVACIAAALVACAAPAPLQPWESRLAGNAIVLLGEVHDNAGQHRLRLDLLRRAFAGGWRAAIAMEQFDVGRQADIDRARRERPRDAQHVIDQAATPAVRAGEGWNWAFYRPYVALALEYDVPLLAANLSNADTRRIVRDGLAAAFEPERLAALGLDRPIASDWQQAQEREIDRGHCGALPAALWPRMAQAQIARDAVMADLLRRQGQRGIVLLAGNGHVRRDLGVPRWLGAEASRLYTVGLLERDDTHTPVSAFDITLRTEVAERADPCAGFKPRAVDFRDQRAVRLTALAPTTPPPSPRAGGR
jgi:uncharacterized iron-regulated protein